MAEDLVNESLSAFVFLTLRWLGDKLQCTF